MSKQIRGRRLSFPVVGRPDRGTVWAEMRRLLLLVLGTALAAFGYVVFQVPFNLAAGGLGGVSLIVNSYTGWPVGTLYFLMTLPLLILGYRQLGRWPFVVRTFIGAALFSIFTDLFILFLPDMLAPYPLTNDLLLNTVYGGITGGIGGGLVYRASSSMGGTGIISRFIQRKTGQPLSQIYMYVDGSILLAMGLVFGWQVTLYGLLMLFINGLASDYTLEGPGNTRVATIVTDEPQLLSAALRQGLDRGTSYWPITGGYTGEVRHMLMCTVYRSQVQEVKRIVAETDPRAFVTIGVGHQALGAGFVRLDKR